MNESCLVQNYTNRACLHLTSFAGDDGVAPEERLAREHLLPKLAVLALQLLDLAAVLALHEANALANWPMLRDQERRGEA